MVSERDSKNKLYKISDVPNRYYNDSNVIHEIKIRKHHSKNARNCSFMQTESNYYSDNCKFILIHR